MRSALARAAPAITVTLLLLAARAANAQGRVLHFGEAVTAATQGTPVVSLATLRLDEARARAGEARGALLPGLSGSAAQSNRTFNLKSFGITFPAPPGTTGLGDLQGPVDLVDARLKVTQTVLDVPSVLRVRGAGQATRAASADRDAAEEQAAQVAALAYLRAARAQAVAEARASDAAIAAELVSLADLQRRAGTAPAIDLTRARTELAAARGDEVVARHGADRARIDLARALGIDPGAPLVIADSLSDRLGESVVPAESASAIRFALERRPELAAERLRLERAHTERAAISAERWPRLDAEADWGVSGEAWADAFPTRAYGVALAMPLFDGGRRESRIAEQRSMARESEIRTHDLRDEISAEMSTALLDLASGREQLGIANERLTLAEAELDQARERFVNGVANNLEIIDAQVALVRARDASIEARFAIAGSRVTVARAAGVARSLH